MIVTLHWFSSILLLGIAGALIHCINRGVLHSQSNRTSLMLVIIFSQIPPWYLLVKIF